MRIRTAVATTTLAITALAGAAGTAAADTPSDFNQNTQIQVCPPNVNMIAIPVDLLSPNTGGCGRA